MNNLLTILLLFTAGNQEDPDIAHLVENLADEQIVVRGEAERKLIELGSSVIERLEQEAGVAGEEVRARIEQVIFLIHREERAKRFNPGPSFITLARKEIDIGDLFQEISRQARSNIDLSYEGQPRPVSVGLERIPYFEAIDRICQEDGNLDYAVQFTTSSQQIFIIEGKYTARPRVFHEQFMAWIDGVYMTDRLDFGQGSNRSGELSLKAVWEPDTIPVSVSFRLDVLKDEKGQSLLDHVQVTPFISRPQGPLFSQRIRFRTLPPKEVKTFSRLSGELVVFFPRDTDLVQFQTDNLHAGAMGKGSTFEAELLEVERDQGDLHVKVKIISQVYRLMPKAVLFAEGGAEIAGRTTGSRTTYGQGISWQTHDLAFELKPDQKPAYLELSTHKGEREKLIPVEFLDVRFRP